MDFSIGGKIFSWLPKHMFHIVGETTEYGNIVCIGVAGSDSHSILGDNWMRSNRITINLEERLFTMNSAQTCKFYPHLQDSSYFSLSKSFTSFLVFI